MWDCDGLESVKACPTPEDLTWLRLQGRPLPTEPNLNHWKLRARYNTQRHYEIYLVDCGEEITEHMIREWFDTDPQGAADLIRERGIQIYSDRLTQQRVIT